MSASEKRLQHPNRHSGQVDSGDSFTTVDTSYRLSVASKAGEGDPTAEILEEFPGEFPEDLPPLFPISKQPRSASKWLWVTALVSIGLHAGFMLVPTGEESKPTPTKSPEQQIRITQLPNLIKQPTIKRPPKPVIKRAVVSSVNRPQATTPLPPASKTEQKTDPSSKDESAGDNPWKDFPLYPGSTPGCFELPSCLQSSDGLGQVSAHFTKELPDKKYTIKRLIQEAGREVYQVSRNGLSQFLSIIENGKDTVYVLSDAPRTLEDLEKAVEVPPEIYAILVGLAVQQADSSAFAQPDQFYTKANAKSLNAGSLEPKSGIRNVSLVSGQTADTMMDEFLRSNLQNSEFEVTDLPQDYGGGKVYQVQKGNLTLYLNLVPTKDNSGTLLVIWKTPPG